MADSNRTALYIMPEVTWNTKPSGDFQTLRYTGESLSHNITAISSNEIRSDRMIPDLIHTQKTGGGGINFEFSYGTFDALMQAALMGAWNTNVLVNAATAQSFSIEKAHLDEAEYFLYTGMMVNSFSLNCKAGEIVTGSFDFLGGVPATPLAQSSGAGTVVAATTTDIFNAIGNVGTILEGGSSLVTDGIYLQEVNFTVNNNLRVRPAIGYDSPIGIGLGRCMVTGSITAYFADDRLFDKFFANTASSLSFVITDAATNNYTFLFDNIKFTSDRSAASGIDTDIIETIEFQALYDSTNAQIKITRDPA